MNTLKKGDKAPKDLGTDQAGNVHKLTDYKGKKLIVFFYPKANTPSCTNEVCNLRDNFKLLKDKGYELLGVSADSVRSSRNSLINTACLSRLLQMKT